MLVGLPFLWRRWRADHLDPLSLLVVTGTVVYLGGLGHRSPDLRSSHLPGGAGAGRGGSRRRGAPRGGVPLERRQHRLAGRSRRPGRPVAAGCGHHLTGVDPHGAQSPAPDVDPRVELLHAQGRRLPVPVPLRERPPGGAGHHRHRRPTHPGHGWAGAGARLPPGLPRRRPRPACGPQALPGSGHQCHRAARHPGALRPAVRAGAPPGRARTGRWPRPSNRRGPPRSTTATTCSSCACPPPAERRRRDAQGARFGSGPRVPGRRDDDGPIPPGTPSLDRRSRSVSDRRRRGRWPGRRRSARRSRPRRSCGPRGRRRRRPGRSDRGRTAR